MGNSLNIENITNGLMTLQKVRQLYTSGNRRDGDAASAENVHPDRLTLFREVLSTITNFAPRARGGSFANAFSQGNRYSSAYRELKRHIRSMNRGNSRQDEIIGTLKLVTPILDNKRKVYMDKVVKILEILQS